jgi:CRISPR-associated exonuclease Cas4
MQSSGNGWGEKIPQSGSINSGPNKYKYHPPFSRIVAKQVITSSEIERFAYCPYSWWLSREGVKGEGAAIKQGVEDHHDLEAGLDLIKEVDKQAGIAEKGLIGFNSGTIILALVGITVLTLGFLGSEKSSHLGAILIIFGLVWTLMASFYLYTYLTRTDVSMTLRANHGVPSGEIEFSDKIRAPSYFSETYMLSGKPDYVIKKGDEYIPVEMKTGRVPRGPFFSHILQVVAYCILIEEKYGKAPHHGILEYTDHTQHPIEFDEDGKKLVLGKMDEMRDMLDGKTKPYRNHNRKGKCINCSRRESCPVRLA